MHPCLVQTRKLDHVHEVEIATYPSVDVEIRRRVWAGGRLADTDDEWASDVDPAPAVGIPGRASAAAPMGCHWCRYGGRRIWI